MNRTALISILSAVALAVPFLAFADDSFVPLTSIPGITSLTGSPTLPAFLNNLYRICIGIAAFLAIGRFIYAGYTIMTDSGSVTKNKKAREMIQNTVIGLILVLSPAVVFGIINPKILDLSLDFSKLQSTNGTGGDVDISKLTGSAKTQAQICAPYLKPPGKLALVTLKGTPAQQTCSDVQGKGWAAVECCQGGAAGQTCCGYDPANDQNVVNNDNLLGPASFSIAYEGRDDLTGKSCLAYDDQSFKDQASCESTYNGKIAAVKGTYAIGKLCSEKTSHTLTPAESAAKLKALPACPQ